MNSPTSLVESDYCNVPNIDREIEIVYELSQNVLKYEEMLNRASDLCGELDRSVRRASSTSLADTV